MYLNDRANDLRPITLGKPVGDMVLHPEFPAEPTEKSGLVPTLVKVNRMGIVYDAIQWAPLMKADIGFLVGPDETNLVVRNRPVYIQPEPEPAEDVEKAEPYDTEEAAEKAAWDYLDATDRSVWVLRKGDKYVVVPWHIFPDPPKSDVVTRLNIRGGELQKSLPWWAVLRKARVWVKKTAKRKGHWRIDRRTKKVEEKVGRGPKKQLFGAFEVTEWNIEEAGEKKLKAGFSDLDGVVPELGTLVKQNRLKLLVRSVSAETLMGVYHANNRELVIRQDSGVTRAHEMGHAINRMLDITGLLGKQDELDTLNDYLTKEVFTDEGHKREMRGRRVIHHVTLSRQADRPEVFRSKMKDLLSFLPEEAAKRITEVSVPKWTPEFRKLYDGLEAAGALSQFAGVAPYNDYLVRTPEIWSRMFEQYVAYKKRGTNAALSINDMYTGQTLLDSGKVAGQAYLTEEQFEPMMPLIKSCVEAKGVTMKSLLLGGDDLTKAKQVWVPPSQKRKGYFRRDPRTKKVEEKKERPIPASEPELTPQSFYDDAIQELSYSTGVQKMSGDYTAKADILVALGETSPRHAAFLLNNLVAISDEVDMPNLLVGSFADRHIRSLIDQATSGGESLYDFRKQTMDLDELHDGINWDLDIRERATFLDRTSSKEDLWYAAMGAWGSSTNKEASILFQEAVKGALGVEGIIWQAERQTVTEKGIEGLKFQIVQSSEAIEEYERALADLPDDAPRDHRDRLVSFLSKERNARTDKKQSLDEAQKRGPGRIRPYYPPAANIIKLQQAVREQYEKTQDYLRGVSGPFPELPLYRGVKEEVETHNVAESWSEERRVAEKFDGHEVLEEMVPIERVLTMYMTDSKLEANHKEYEEAEYIVLAGDPK